MWDKFRRIVTASALVLTLPAGPAIVSAQQVPEDVPAITIRVNTRLVVVDVVATDKKGQPVTGLKPEDFTLEENGKKQKISVFVPPSVAHHTAAPAPAPAGVLSNHPENVLPTGVPTVLLLDATNSSFSNQAYARSQMLRYVVEQSHAGQPMAVVTLTDQLRVLQDFTGDPQILLTAIKNYKPQAQPFQGTPPAIDASAMVFNFANIQIGYNTERRILITLDGMHSLTRMLGGLPGRKNVVWLTASLPFDLIPQDRNITDAELRAELPGQGKQRSVGVNSAGAQAAEQRELHNPEIREAEALLASAGIAIYPVDLRGLVSGMENSANRGGQVYSNPAAVSDRALGRVSGMQASQGTMEEVAAQTGGKAYFNDNEIKDGVALAVSDDKASYSLGYYPENKKWDGKLRNIKVKLDRGDTQIRYRKGYFAIEPGR
jgi:VWFA-related protein